MGAGRAVLLALCGIPATVVAQLPTGHEVGIQAVGVLASSAFVGGGLSYGLRPGDRVRVAVLAAIGDRDGTVTGRGELVLHYLLAPDRRRGVGIYGLGGIAGLTDVGGALVLGLGIEGAPGGRSGWVVEAGIGGGPRLSVGWRWRRLHRAAPPP